MPGIWSQEAPADVIAIVESIVAASDATGTTVFEGRASKGAAPPFITCWMLGPETGGAGLGQECWGVHWQRWQISAHGVTQGQARYLAERLLMWDWPADWEWSETGPMIEATTDKPTTWFVPVTLVSRDMGGQATTGSGFNTGFDTGF